MDDADLELAVAGAVYATYTNAGQDYAATDKIILHTKIADKFRQYFLAALKKLKIGDPNLNNDVVYGPLISQQYRDGFMAHYAWAKAEGAELLYGLGHITRDKKPVNFVGDPDKGLYVWPVIWDKVKIEMKLAQTDVLGPMVSLIEVADLDEALAVTNGTSGALSMFIYTRDPHHVSQCKEALQASHLLINALPSAIADFRSLGLCKEGLSDFELGLLDVYTEWCFVYEEGISPIEAKGLSANGVREQQVWDRSVMRRYEA